MSVYRYALLRVNKGIKKHPGQQFLGRRFPGTEMHDYDHDESGHAIHRQLCFGFSGKLVRRLAFSCKETKGKKYSPIFPFLAGKTGGIICLRVGSEQTKAMKEAQRFVSGESLACIRRALDFKHVLALLEMLVTPKYAFDQGPHMSLDCHLTETLLDLSLSLQVPLRPYAVF
jgi:hypothetical protein